jgi:hypothetical protein
MSTEENVPQSRFTNVAEYRQAARKHNNKIRRQEALRAIPKVLGIIVGAAAVLVAFYFVTQWLLASHRVETNAPPELLAAMAVIGALLIVGGIVVIVRLIAMTPVVLMKDVGFNLYFVSIGGVAVVITAVVIAVVTTIYLSVFYAV